MSKIHRSDWDLVPVDADPNFDPEHNKRVIEETIKENDLKRAKMEKEHTEEIRERSAALATYLEHLKMGGASTDMLTYFGKKELARLRGEQLIKRLQDPLIVRDGTGKIIRRQGDAEAHS